MSDATAEFFDELGRRGHEPLLEKATGTVRFDLGDGHRRPSAGSSQIDKGDSPSRARARAADCTSSAPTRRSSTASPRGEMNADGRAAARRRSTLEGDSRLLVLFQRLLPGPPPHGPPLAHDSEEHAMSDGARQDPRRQHVRRQRRARRHRGVADRPDRPLLVRHALPVEVGADDRRPAAERALGRRPAVLRDALLPRARAPAPSTSTPSSR